MGADTVTAEALSPDLVRSLTHRDVLEWYGCWGKPSSCMDLFHRFIEAPNWRCDTEANMYAGGSWVGHILPGAVFLLWASHWLLGTFDTYLQSKARNQRYRSRGCHSLPGAPWTWRIEAWCKVLIPPFAIAAELYLAHCSNGHCQYRNLYCPTRTYTHILNSTLSLEQLDDAQLVSMAQQQGVPVDAFISPSSTGGWDADRTGWATTWDVDNWRARRLDGGHLNNWQHGSMYPAFIVSGIIDLMAPATEAPEGTQQVYLALSFLVEAMLMGLHKKHTPLDRIVHECLFYTMLATAAFSAAEAAWPHSFLLSCGRVAAAYLQSIWFLAAARIIFEGHPAWDVGGPESGSLWKNDVTPSLYTPVLFTALSALVPLILVLVWAVMRHLYMRSSEPTGNPNTGTLSGAGMANQKKAPTAWPVIHNACMSEGQERERDPWRSPHSGHSSEQDMDEADMAGQVLPVTIRVRD